MVNDFRNLFIAWMAVWAIFFLYEVSIARRVSRLKGDIAELRQQLSRK
jgi:hypothetical protein